MACGREVAPASECFPGSVHDVAPPGAAPAGAVYVNLPGISARRTTNGVQGLRIDVISIDRGPAAFVAVPEPRTLGKSTPNDRRASSVRPGRRRSVGAPSGHHGARAYISDFGVLEARCKV